MSKKQLTVADLIAQLATMPPDAKVHTEGCDCWGKASGVSMVEHKKNAVLIQRAADRD